jgi:transposase
METLWIGIDIAKASLVAAALWQTESVSLGEFANEQAGFISLAAQVQADQIRRGAAAVQWVNANTTSRYGRRGAPQGAPGQA